MSTTTKARITLATIKAFIRRYRENLHIDNIASFDSMTDGVETHQGHRFDPVVHDDSFRNSLGVSGAWFVFQSRDFFEPYDDGAMIGYRVWNSCGRFILAVPKNMMSARASATGRGE